MAGGTFKVCPRLCPQVYSVRAAIGGYCLPRIYALLPDKSQETYIRTRREISNLARPEEDVQERLVNMDFERAAINAFVETFPQSNFAGVSSTYDSRSIARRRNSVYLGNTRPTRTSAFGRRPSPP